ncbi:MAG: thioredoxin domain-containing protein, partial [Gemmatimonadales bacterium]
YFPPENNQYGRPGFLSLLAQVARTYREEREKVVKNAAAISRHVTESLDEAKRGTITPRIVEQAADQMARLFDIRYGGFGTAPKFPHPGSCEFLLAHWRDTGLDWPRQVVEKTLVGMAKGGIRDHVGGGFHRYAVDERWIVPHFEKMAYDNAELLKAYLAGSAALGLPLLRETANGIVDWVLEVLSDREQGVFFTSQDADTAAGDDGDYWTWTPDEVRSALDAGDAELVCRVFDVEEPGEMHHDPRKNVLWWKRDPAGDDEWTRLRAALGRLKAARDRRPAPVVDRTPYVSWNAMLASAFFRAGAVLDRPECNALALRVLNRIWAEAWHDARGMAHVIGREEPHGLLDDNVQSAAAFLDAYEATGDQPWLDRTTAVMAYCAGAHWDDTAGGYFDTARDRGGVAYLSTRAKPVQDAPTPSPNGVAALVLARLGALTDRPEWRTQLERQLEAFAGGAAELSLYGATLFRALDWAVHPVTRVEVSGPRGEGEACAMHHLALGVWRPRTVVVRRTAERPAATVCVGTTCSLPVHTAAALADLLR